MDLSLKNYKKIRNWIVGLKIFPLESENSLLHVKKITDLPTVSFLFYRLKMESFLFAPRTTEVRSARFCLHFSVVTAGHRILSDRTLKVQSGTYLEPYPPFHGSGVNHVEANFIPVVLTKRGHAGGPSVNSHPLIPFDAASEFSSAVPSRACLPCLKLSSTWECPSFSSVPLPFWILLCPSSGSVAPNQFPPQSGFPRASIVLTIFNTIAGCISSPPSPSTHAPV